MEKVIFKECSDYEKAQETLRSILEGYSFLIKPGMKVFLKPNLLAPSLPEEGVTTHPAVLEAVLKFVLDCGGVPSVGDSPASSKGYQAAKKGGLIEVCERYKVPFEELDDPVEVTGSVFKKIRISEKVLKSDLVINLPKLKAHSLMILTLAVKNTFGCVPGKDKTAWHIKALSPMKMADLFIDIHQVVKPSLNILDGITGMEGNGPANGSVKNFGVIGVSENGFALDDAVCKRLKVNPSRVFINNRAKNLLLFFGHKPMRSQAFLRIQFIIIMRL